jgi:hypothetical protein
VNLKPHLQRTSECVAVERLGEVLTEAEQAHVRGCARCEAELTLWQSFDEARPAADEGAAVQWIVSELKRRREPDAARRAHRGWFVWRPLVGLAAVLLAIGGGFLFRNPEPQLAQPTASPHRYRTETIKVVGPTGDLSSAPPALSWVALTHAVEYDVQVLEIDQTRLWSTTVRDARVELPQAVLARVLPGKTLHWLVTARDQSGRQIGESGTQSFRVVVAAKSGGK